MRNIGKFVDISLHFIYTKYYIGKTTVEDYLFTFINKFKYNVYAFVPCIFIKITRNSANNNTSYKSMV